MAMLLDYDSRVDKIRTCPVASNPTTRMDASPSYTYGTADQTWKWAPSSTNYLGSYAFNGWLYTGTYSVSDLLGAPDSWKYGGEAKVSSPVDVPVNVDAMWVDGWPTEIQGPGKDLYKGNADVDMGRFAIARHGRAPGAITVKTSQNLPGAVNIVFYDGHAESKKLSQLWNLSWHSGWVIPATIPNPK
jgi:prepilin-type processing-associated H-X9-DG protein